MMPMMKYTRLYAVPFLIINAIGFPTHVIADPGSRHEVSLISSINKHPPFELLPAERFDGNNPVVFSGYAIFPIQPFISQYFDFIFFYKILKNLLSHMRLEYPHRSGIAINGWSPLALVAILGAVLPLPCLVGLVMVIYFLVKFPGDPSNDFLLAGIGKSQPS